MPAAFSASLAIGAVTMPPDPQQPGGYAYNPYAVPARPDQPEPPSEPAAKRPVMVIAAVVLLILGAVPLVLVGALLLLGGNEARAAITPELARELEEYGLLQPRREGGEKLYPAGDVDVAVACAKLARFGISARHLRTFRTAADREAGLLEQLVAPSLRSRSQERRDAAVQQLQTLAEVAQELSQLLFWRDLRHVAGH